MYSVSVQYLSYELKEPYVILEMTIRVAKDIHVAERRIYRAVDISREIDLLLKEIEYQEKLLKEAAKQ